MQHLKTSNISIKALFLLCIAFLSTNGKLKAKEGMWLPMLIEKQLISEMHIEGLMLSSEDIYSINKACIKDAVVKISSGCTAEFISQKGLIITNHHCSDDYIQALSTLKNNYLINGFWSEGPEQDIPIEGFSVKILESMQDVTTLILKNVEPEMNETKRATIIQFNINRITKQLSEDGNYSVQVKKLYHGNQYIAFISKEFKDVRLVGAPPISIADFGGDEDNWRWPRHGADFALFRVYANKKNKPAPYHKENIPFTPKKSLPIQLNGFQPGDFTFIMGYPGTTDLYATSYKLSMLKNDLYPARIGVRTQKLNVMKDAMQKSDELKLKYSAKASNISNSWKRWQGEINGIDRLQVLEEKKQFEQDIAKWSSKIFPEENPANKLFNEYKSNYAEFAYYYVPNRLIVELTGKNGLETISFSRNFPSLQNVSDFVAANQIKSFLPEMRTHFKDYDAETDKELTGNLLAYYLQNVPKKYVPKELRSIEPYDSAALKKFVSKLFKKTYFADSVKLKSLMQLRVKKVKSKLQKDPAMRLNKQFSDIQFNTLKPSVQIINKRLDSLNRIYMQLILKKYNNKVLPPDANSGMRITYGKVEGYTPRDGVDFHYFTTVEGIMEKGKRDSDEFFIHERLKELYMQKDLGVYSWNGTLPVCFTASNHTTGGNSGSPVLNKNGEMIGINFDRAWEGVVSDFYYSPQISRNISVDIRYVLFIIDKFAGAKYLLDEMNIVR